jgi:hypothetical protein
MLSIYVIANLLNTNFPTPWYSLLLIKQQVFVGGGGGSV